MMVWVECWFGWDGGLGGMVIWVGWWFGWDGDLGGMVVWVGWWFGWDGGFRYEGFAESGEVWIDN